MRGFKFLSGVFLSVIIFAGCLRVNTTINVNPDGSGTIEEIVFMKGEVLEMIRQFASSFDESGEAEEFSFYKEEEQKNKAGEYGEGVMFLNGEEIFETGWEGYKVTYSFSDINKLKLDPSPDNKVNLGDEVPEETEADRQFITFNFKKGNPSELNITFPLRDFDDANTTESQETVEADTTDEGMTEMFKRMFDGMRISVNVNVNGNISETNASFIEGTNLTLMDIDFANLLKNEDMVKKLESKKPESLEEFREITKDIDGIKIEFNDEVKVKFR